MRYLMRALSPAAVLVGVFLSGCGENKPAPDAATPYDRQERALHDPFNYSPNVGKSDISGGGIGEYRKDAMQRDVNDVFNP
ncbi:MAG: hypothetical protein JWL69_2482 [Phycisphaerales bacterium]|nr:hypothetical protein [Phycisphaerales bacterium]MDB5353866.1 hypothetical protein [Phycisphaerales bacterium]